MRAVQIIPVGTTGTYSVEIIQGRTAGCTVNYLGANTCAAGGGVLLQAFTQGTTGYQQWTFTEVGRRPCTSTGPADASFSICLFTA